MTEHTLHVPGARLVHDVLGPLPAADGRPPLLMIGQPMDASGFRDLAAHFPERTVVLYDPRGLGRSVREDGREDHDPVVQAEDLHALVAELGAGPVEVFASSGGAVTALALLAAHPGDLSVLVAHEPPLAAVLPDERAVLRAFAEVGLAYGKGGWGAGMAGFLALTTWEGPFTEEYFARPLPGPAAFGLPEGDDGERSDPLLSGRSDAVISYEPALAALGAARTRLVVGVGEETGAEVFTGRAAHALAERLGTPPVVFPSHHGGFTGGEGPYAGQPEAFARVLREVLDGA
ncbi:alpha/beta hydrolase [Streptomyces sp. NPDC047046]|uniref:alpha/beta fold hydrolase n=1 Tax=Streptomyces sp. NPDC047046 TaxID=3155378 RepID=UPI0033F3423F